MDIVFFLLPISVLLAVVALGGYVWANRSGQFEDLETPALRILGDDTPANPPVETVRTDQNNLT